MNEWIEKEEENEIEKKGGGGREKREKDRGAIICETCRNFKKQRAHLVARERARNRT